MSLSQLKFCPSLLTEGFHSYSPAALRRLFQGKLVSHILSYDSPQSNEADMEKFQENRKRISISGVQDKFSLALHKNQLRLTEPGEHGAYILKPVPRDLKKTDQLPANEHLTMQIASQVYGIQTAVNGMIFFKNGDPAYITRRFDVKDDGSKLGSEDFASLAGKASNNAGPNFKYDYSYEEIGALIRRFVPAWRIEIEKYFSIIIFNYLFSNGDAHLKNFSLLQSESGDYTLSPAYDLVNTRIHVDDSDLALDKGLFADGYQSKIFQHSNHPGRKDFMELGRRLSIDDSRVEKLMQPFLEKQEMTVTLINRSFLAEPVKRGYLLDYNNRRNKLNAV